ncbi:MAG TPA: NlpC/P60 family protein [Jatrophihabitans sp.]
MIDAAASEKETLANQVGTLAKQLASLQAQLDELLGKREQAEQNVALAQAQLDDATAKAASAKAAVGTAEQSVQTAQSQFVMYAQAVYMNGSVAGGTGTLLTAQDPSALLDSTALQQYQTSHQTTAIGQLQQATIVKSNAEAASRRAVADETAATAKAKQAKDAAVAAVEDAKNQQAAITQQQTQVQGNLDAAQNNLANLNGQRAQYQIWHGQQIVLADKAEQTRQEAIQAQEEAKLAKIKRDQAASDAQKAQKELQEQKDALNASQSDTSGQSSSSSASVPVPTGGSWTAAKAQKAVSRALNWLGETYIWAGGNGAGPTTGGCTDPIAPCGTVGFDCSGLALYAWAPYISMIHYAATQYTQAGSYHPSSNNFQPGDLLFWSYNGSISGIHHVAMYIGGGYVIQAPQSGDVVRKTRWDYVSSGYYGATRPLT